MMPPSSAGWYDDPEDSEALRYFDGREWGRERRRKPRQSQTPNFSALPPTPAPLYQPIAPYTPVGRGPDFVDSHQAPRYDANQPARGYVPYIPAAPHSQTNELALWSLISSIAGIFFGPFAIAGLIMGIIALDQVNKSGQRGKGMAIAGIAVGGVALLFAAIILGAIITA